MRSNKAMDAVADAYDNEFVKDGDAGSVAPVLELILAEDKE